MHYFAYGSNMSLPRIRARVPSARFRSVGILTGHRLVFRKIGRDGSAKCDIEACDDEVYGVVYEMAEHERPVLDRVEDLGQGYECKPVDVKITDGGIITAFTYYAIAIDKRLTPFAWYLRHVVHGARQHRLPPSYISKIESTLSIDDPDVDRQAAELSIYTADGAPR